MQIASVYTSEADRSWLIGELRSDQAGETGAVWIYHGVLAVSRDAEVGQFAREHLATEQSHLETINSLVPAGQRSLLLPLWRIAGFALGAVPALFGREAVYQTIEAVETFVEGHYRDQIERLYSDGKVELAEILENCMNDEIRHRREAAGNRTRSPGRLGRTWQSIIDAGSRGAVVLARRI